MNIARLFSYTRRIEQENAELKERVLELESRLEERTSYAFALSGRPTPEAVKARSAELLEGKAGGDLQPIPPRTNLRMLRRNLVKDILAKREPQDKPMRAEEMSSRADEYAAKVKSS